ncbi:MAG: manganese efflux pump [Moraxella sp.]|nr:manganese efflux pump [Moraxella sp.]
MNIFALTSLTAKGAINKHSNFIRTLQAGLFFGVVEAVAPLIGYGLGSVASEQVASIDHWLAFVLLTILGVRFIVQIFNDKPYDNEQQGRFGRARGIGRRGAMVIGVLILYSHLTA